MMLEPTREEMVQGQDRGGRGMFLDVTTTSPAPDGGFVGAAARGPGRLRIAVSTKSPLGLAARVGKAQRAAVAEAADLLRELGHDVVERAPDYLPLRSGWNVTARYVRGVHDDVATMPHPERLEGRTRTMARAGGRVSDRRMARIPPPRPRSPLGPTRSSTTSTSSSHPRTAVGPPRSSARWTGAAPSSRST